MPTVSPPWSNVARVSRSASLSLAPSVVRSLVVLLVLSLVVSSPALAHGGGVLRLASPTAAVGGSISLTGDKMEKNANLQLELRGTLDNYPVGQVRTDSAGKFRMSIVLPPHVPAGAYSLVAIAPDGDVAARTDLTLTVAAASTGMMGEHGSGAMPAMHATDEMMALHVSTSPAEWLAIAAFLLATVGGGLVLLRRSAVTGDHRG